MIRKKRVLVVGNGLTGKAVFEKTNELGGKAEYFDVKKDLTLEDYDFSVISPGISRKSETYIKLKGSGIPIYSEVDFAFMLEPFKAISVSGTNGKTTVVNLICGMLNSANIDASLVGNVGVPFCQRKKSDWYVAEISSFMLEQSKFFRSQYSAITNIAPDHKEFHGTFERYKKAKLKLFKYTEKGVVFDEKHIKKDWVPENLQTLRYSIDDKSADIFVEDEEIKYREKGQTFKVVNFDKIHIVGRHNVENIMNSLGLCVISNGFRKGYADFIESYRGEKWRLEYKGVINGKKVFNDSKGTNVAAVMTAYRCMKGTTALILGGYDKKESYRPLFEILKAGDKAIISGDNAEIVSEEAGKANVIHVKTSTLEEAIIKAFKSNVQNILFSPGCSSFDRFTSFEERGKFFDEFIEKIKQ